LKVIILTAAPANIAANQRFRFEHYIGLTDTKGCQFELKSFYSAKTWGVLHKNNFYFQKVIGIFAGFIKRIIVLFSIYKYDFVYVHREASPIGPPIFEWFIAKVLKKKMIFDFDDSIWIRGASEANPMVAGIKCTWKVKYICQYSKTVTVGNDFLAAYAGKYCSDVRVIPTVVNTHTMHNKLKDQAEKPLTIGWTGTFTNFSNLEKIIPAIKKLEDNYKFNLLIIANKNPLLPKINYEYKPWNVDTEIEDLLRMNIGLMPLANTEIELGKCGFKAIQYMSLGIPAVVSPVGANKDVVINEEIGFLVEKDTEWYEKLELLLKNPELRTIMGKKAKAHIVANFSVDSSKKLFFDLFSSSQTS